MDLLEIFESSKAVTEFDTTEKKLLDNDSFIMAWGIARKKSLENIQLIYALLIIKKKYKISNFEFELMLENIDEDNLFGES
jgi:hypothetical protein